MSSAASTRLEGFSDAVFALCATLLILTLEVPRTYEDLVYIAQGFAPFGLSFAMLIFIWHEHHMFFKRYPLVDTWIVIFNSALLFVVLFYVYPLQLLARLLASALGLIDSPASAILMHTDGRGLYVIYFLGAVAVFLCLALLYLRAFAQRDRLQLGVLETFQAKWHAQTYLIVVAVTFVSLLLALLGIGLSFGLPGWASLAVAPLVAWHSHRFSAREEELKRSADTRVWRRT